MKNLLAAISLGLALPFVIPGTALADREHNPEFRQIVSNLQASPERVVSAVIFEGADQPSGLESAQVARLTEIAKDQAQVWGDTILEGDYHADGDTTLDEVEELRIGGELVGYRITYSEAAWDTASCDYDGSPETLEQCRSGRVQESSFVSRELNNWTRDPNGYAEFVD